jgi:hypothetical protein
MTPEVFWVAFLSLLAVLWIGAAIVACIAKWRLRYWTRKLNEERARGAVLAAEKVVLAEAIRLAEESSP